MTELDLEKGIFRGLAAARRFRMPAAAPRHGETGDGDAWRIDDEDLVVHAEQLGKGSMGVVFAGTLCSCQPVAVKGINGQPEDQCHEAQALADLQQVVQAERPCLTCVPVSALARARALRSLAALQGQPTR